MDRIKSRIAIFFVTGAFAALGGWAGLRNGKAAVRDVGKINTGFQGGANGWQFSDSIGTDAASPLERARIAIGGPLALAASETIYFLTLTDASGAPLNSSCVYSVSGRDFEARWWSIAIYDGATRAYIANQDNRSSWNNAVLLQDGAEDWQFVISPKRPDAGNWLPSQTEPDRSFELLLRLYNPSDETRAAAAQTLALPVVEKTSC